MSYNGVSGIYFLTEPESVGELFKLLAESDELSPISLISNLIKKYMLQQKQNIIEKLNKKLEEDFETINSNINKYLKEVAELYKKIEKLESIPYENRDVESLYKLKEKILKSKRELEFNESHLSELKPNYERSIEVLNEYEILALKGE